MSDLSMLKYLVEELRSHVEAERRYSNPEELTEDEKRLVANVDDEWRMAESGEISDPKEAARIGFWAGRRDGAKEVERVRANILSSIEQALSASDDAMAFWLRGQRVPTDRVMEVEALFASLLEVAQRCGTDPAQAFHDISYVVYAYLGGEARHEASCVSNATKKYSGKDCCGGKTN